MQLSQYSNFFKLLLVFFTLFGLVQCSNSDSQKQNNTSKSSVNNIKVAKLLQDLDTLKMWIEKAHGDPYRFTTPEKLKAQFNKAEQKIRDSKGLTKEHFLGVLLPIMAELRDGHSQALLRGINKVNGKVLPPIRFTFIKQKPYLVADYSQQKLPIGAEITAINGTKAEQFFKDLIPLVHGDGNIQSIRYRRLENMNYLCKVLDAIGRVSNTYQVTFKTKTEEKTYQLKAINQQTYNTALNKQKTNIVQKEVLQLDINLNNKAIAYLKVKSFNTNYFKDNYSLYAKRIDSLMARIQQSKAKTLILDLRNNTGGEDSYNLYLLRYLMKEKFVMDGQVTFKQNNYKFLPDGKHWDITPDSFKPNKQGTYDATDKLWDKGLSTLGEFTPFKNHFRGKLIVLINAYTFSAGSDCAAILHEAGIGTFIGEETGGSYIGTVSGFTPTIDLPNSKVMINLSLMNIRRAFFKSKFTDRGVIPDVQVIPSVDDILEKRDVVKLKAIEIAENEL